MYHRITHQKSRVHMKRLLFLVISHLGGLYSAVKMLKDRLAILFALMDKMESGEFHQRVGRCRVMFGFRRGGNGSRVDA